ncbi:hypothetical protein RJT34_21918 [Clitoria ternatea]|uniref:CCHC-type domain-containing protein n=1 Tax=Clitoria ternatea TaxID=43366 RepID=A0AAN9P6P8_CLITE
MRRIPMVSHHISRDSLLVADEVMEDVGDSNTENTDESMAEDRRYVDHLTSIHYRGHFPRICVEVNLQRQLVPRISMLGHELNLEYEGLHLICFKCGRYGHRSDACVDSPPVLTWWRITDKEFMECGSASTKNSGMNEFLDGITRNSFVLEKASEPMDEEILAYVGNLAQHSLGALKNDASPASRGENRPVEAIGGTSHGGHLPNMIHIEVCWRKRDVLEIYCCAWEPKAIFSSYFMGGLCQIARASSLP